MSLLMSSSCCPLNCYLVSIAPNRHEFDGRPGRARVQSSPAAAALSQIQQPAGQPHRRCGERRKSAAGQPRGGCVAAALVARPLWIEGLGCKVFPKVAPHCRSNEREVNLANAQVTEPEPRSPV